MNRDADHPFLRPLWRRILLVAFCAAWGLFELLSGSPGWALLFGGMAAYGAWLYLINYRPGEARQGDAPSSQTPKE